MLYVFLESVFPYFDGGLQALLQDFVLLPQSKR